MQDISLASIVKRAQRSQPIGRWASSTRPSDKNRKKSLAEARRAQHAPREAV
jgi:hypothetical protein